MGAAVAAEGSTMPKTLFNKKKNTKKSQKKPPKIQICCNESGNHKIVNRLPILKVMLINLRL